MKKKIMVLVPVHCAPKVAMMTLGTWLDAADGSYTAEIVLGVHQNYHHYHDGLASLQGLPVSIVSVPEINWTTSTPMEALIRYSKMHSVSLSAMLETVRNEPFDHLAILDHDLVFKKDFVGWAAEQDADLIGNFMDDREVPVAIQTGVGPLMFAPKFSVWHMAMTEKFYRRIMDNVNLIFPEIKDGWFYDTFSRVVEMNITKWSLRQKIVKKAEMEEMVQHLWSMSFNFGPYMRGYQDYWDRLHEREMAFDQRFPNGIGHLFGKVGL